MTDDDITEELRRIAPGADQLALDALWASIDEHKAEKERVERMTAGFDAGTFKIKIGG